MMEPKQEICRFQIPLILYYYLEILAQFVIRSIVGILFGFRVEACTEIYLLLPH